MMKRTSLSLRSLLLAFFLQVGGLMGVLAQDEELADTSPFTASDSAVVHFDQNHLLFPAGTQAFEPVLQMLSSFPSDEASTLRVLHIGGSHVQADVFSARLRGNLQTLLSGQSVNRGVMFPFSVMGTNGPRDYSFTSTGTWNKTRNIDKSPVAALGLSGAALITNGLSATLTLRSGAPFESLLLLGHCPTDTAWVYPILIADGDTLYPPRASQETGYEFLFSHPVTQCTMLLQGDSCGSFVFRGMMADPSATGIIYNASGINGASVPSWLRCQAFGDELQALTPDLALLGIGINDANVQNFQPEQFKQNYRQLLSQIRQVSPHCVFLFLVNNDCYLNVGSRRRKSYNRNTEKVEQAFLELATEYQGAVWNLYQVMGGLGSSDRWVKAGLMRSDHIHFTARGYNLLGDLLFTALREAMR